MSKMFVPRWPNAERGIECKIHLLRRKGTRSLYVEVSEGLSSLTKMSSLVTAMAWAGVIDHEV